MAETAHVKQGRSTRAKETLRVIKYALCAGSAGIIETVSFTLLNETMNWPYWPSYLIALVLSVLWNFTLNRKFTYRSANNVPLAMFPTFCF
ncbi:MAG: GtrA family protein, partial [Clostridia bacterium]|nr:GtrA family protein [Clostridia bacterium]